MPDELENFQTTGPSWQERAEKFNDLSAVYAPGNSETSKWLSLLSTSCLEIALQKVNNNSVVVDFGCGIGYQTRRIHDRVGTVMGFDVTSRMIDRSIDSYGQLPIRFEKIDGVHLPVPDNSVDLIWVSGVLRYSLLVSDPRHSEIVQDFYRALKPGGRVYNFEMYVDLPSDIFSKDFLNYGFQLLAVSVVHVYKTWLDRLATKKYKRLFLRKWFAKLSIEWTRRNIDEHMLQKELRDYLFEYRKPVS